MLIIYEIKKIISLLLKRLLFLYLKFRLDDYQQLTPSLFSHVIIKLLFVYCDQAYGNISPITFVKILFAQLFFILINIKISL